MGRGVRRRRPVEVGHPGLGLYVSPKRDLVATSFFSTYNDLPGYARAIVKTLPAGR